MIRLVGVLCTLLISVVTCIAQEHTHINRDTLLVVDPLTGKQKMVIVEDVLTKQADSVVHQEMIIDIPSLDAQPTSTGQSAPSIPIIKERLQTDSLIGKGMSVKPRATIETRPDTIIIAGVGDVMLGTNFPGNGQFLPPNDGGGLLAEAAPFLQSAHVAFANMEGAISDDAPLEKRCKDLTRCYAFRMPIRYANHLQQAGFDMLSMANNHAWDFGIAGIRDASSTLDRLHIAYAGPLQFPWDTITRHGVKIGIAAFAPNKGCMHLLDRQKAAAVVAHLDSIADLVVVSFHGGAEGREHQHVTGANEYYYGENRGNVQAFARAMVDAGADIVFGHGPHVVRAVELYNDRFIAYSLGNFATYARFNLTGVNGYAPLMQVHADGTGKFIAAKVVSFLQRGEGGPVLDPDQLAFKQIERLTNQDIPNSGLQFADGWIRVANRP